MDFTAPLSPRLSPSLSLALAVAGLGAELAPLSASAGEQLTTPTQANCERAGAALCMSSKSK